MNLDNQLNKPLKIIILIPAWRKTFRLPWQNLCWTMVLNVFGVRPIVEHHGGSVVGTECRLFFNPKSTIENCQLFLPP
jgi:hypothetical protein